MERGKKKRHILSVDLGSEIDSILKFTLKVLSQTGERTTKTAFIQKAILNEIKNSDPIIWEKVQTIRDEARKEKLEEKKRIMALMDNELLNDIKENINLSEEGSEDDAKTGASSKKPKDSKSGKKESKN